MNTHATHSSYYTSTDRGWGRYPVLAKSGYEYEYEYEYGYECPYK